MAIYDSCGSCAACQIERPYHCVAFGALNTNPGRRRSSAPLSTTDGELVYSSFFGQSSLASHAVIDAKNAIHVPDDVPLNIAGTLGCGFLTGAGAVTYGLDGRTRRWRMLTLGWAAEFRDRPTTFTCLWPESLIDTAAVRNLVGGAQRARDPRIMADAAIQILLNSSQFNVRSVDDADVLADCGITDLAGYGGGPSPQLDLFIDHPRETPDPHFHLRNRRVRAEGSQRRDGHRRRSVDRLIDEGRDKWCQR